MQVKDNLSTIEDNIRNACERVGRNRSEINIIAVTKYVSTERAEEALEAGISHLGENRDDGLRNKWEVLRERPTWHFIGSLQTRKVKSIIDKVQYIHSLDRISLAKEIFKRADKPVSCFIQVNVSGEESKHGIEPNELEEFVLNLKEFEDKVNVIGLMTMAPLTEDEEALRSYFRKLKDLSVLIQSKQLPYAPCTELSMGMSNDYEIAIEEGATYIRIGTALVG